jgi:hypothetical protein
MRKLAYLCIRKGLPPEDAQRAALSAAGLGCADLDEVWVDRIERKLRPGQNPQPERIHVWQAAEDGDEVWVARPGVLASTMEDGLAFLASLAETGAALCIASTGRRYSQADPTSVIRFAADIAADLRAATLEQARRKISGTRRPRGSSFADETWEWAGDNWRNAALTQKQIEDRTGISGTALRRRFGKRGTPRFGKPPKGKRTKP